MHGHQNIKIVYITFILLPSCHNPKLTNEVTYIKVNISLKLGQDSPFSTCIYPRL